MCHRIARRREKREWAEKVLEEIRAENVSNLAKSLSLVQEATQTLNSINPKKSMPRRIIVKLLKTVDKGNILKAAREKWLTLGEEQFDWQQISHKKPWRPEGNCTTLSKCWKTTTATTTEQLPVQNPISSKILLQEWRGKSRHCQMKENWFCH